MPFEGLERMSGRLLGYALPDARAPTASDGMTASAAPALGPFSLMIPKLHAPFEGPASNHQLAGTMPPAIAVATAQSLAQAENSFSSAIVSSGLGSFRQNLRLASFRQNERDHGLRIADPTSNHGQQSPRRRGLNCRET
jgi:hypothetical protein